MPTSRLPGWRSMIVGLPRGARPRGRDDRRQRLRRRDVAGRRHRRTPSASGGWCSRTATATRTSRRRLQGAAADRPDPGRATGRCAAVRFACGAVAPPSHRSRERSRRSLLAGWSEPGLRDAASGATRSGSRWRWTSATRSRPPSGSTSFDQPALIVWGTGGPHSSRSRYAERLASGRSPTRAWPRSTDAQDLRLRSTSPGASPRRSRAFMRETADAPGRRLGPV